MAGYKKHGAATQYGNLSMNMIVEPKKERTSYPFLKGKGCEVKDVVPLILEIWKEEQRPGNVDDQRVESMLKSHVAFEIILHDHKQDPFLPRAKAEQLISHVERILQCYSLLANSGDVRYAMLWPTPPKLHYLYHLALRSRLLNPRVGNCMVDESYLKICKDIVQSVASACPASLVPTKCMEKYCRGMTFELLKGPEYHS